MSDTWVGHFGKSSKKLDKNCGFSNKSTFLGQTSLWVAFIVKSAIFTGFYWNFAKMSDTWVGHFDKISKTLDKNCGFSNKSTFLGQTSLWVAQKYAFIRKSPIFIGFFWYFAKMSDTWVAYFDKVSKKYDKNCGFSNKSTFLGQKWKIPKFPFGKSPIFCLHRDCCKKNVKKFLVTT